ncbi:MAG TPA: DNA primase [Desulfobulbus sp.]|nr:DNA primase [Desulfobulbus sp.]
MAVPDSREEVKNRVREAADIVEVIGECVQLKRAGSRYTGLCPFHAEKTPSFSVNPQGQFFHCFGCGESGDVFSFVMKYHHMGFPEALETLARRYHIDLPRRRLSDRDKIRIREREALYQVNEAAALLYQQCLSSGDVARAAREYLQQRQVPDGIVEKYRLGYAPAPESGGWDFITRRLRAKKFSVADIERAGLAVRRERGGHYDRFRDRVLFPIQDMTGRVVAFGGRILGDGKPKYMNSPESAVFDKSRILFGLFQHRQAIRQGRRALVVEGNFDLILLAVHGIDNVVAPLGTSLTRAHVRLLRGYCDEVVLLFDGDAAGLKAAMRSVPLFLAEQVEGKVAILPEGHDPDSLVREQGPEAVHELVAAARPLAEFVFDSLVRRHGLTLSGKSRIIGELQELVSQSSDPAQKSLMAAHFGEKLGVAPERFLSRSAARKPAGAGTGAEHPPSGETIPRRERQLLDFLILYPEHFRELQEAGLEEVVSGEITCQVIDALKRGTAEGTCSCEQLLSLLQGDEERRYVAELLMREPESDLDDDEARNVQAQSMCEELITWIRLFRQRKSSRDLLRRISEAQQSGDTALLMELLRRRQEEERKRTGFSDNLLNKI